MIRGRVDIPVRLALLAVLLLSGAYALMAYLPFTYQGVVKFSLVGWLPVFVRAQPLLFLGAWGLNAWIDRGGQGNRLRRGFHLLQGLLALVLLLKAPLAGIPNAFSSLLWAFGFFLSGLALLLLDLGSLQRGRGPLLVGEDEARRLFLAALIGGSAWALFSLGRALPGESRFLLFAWSWLAHLIAFQILALLVFGLTALGRLWGRTWAEPALLLVLGGGLATAHLKLEVFAALGFSGGWAWLTALLLGAQAAAFLLWVSLRVGRHAGHLEEAAPTGMDLLLAPLRPLFGRGRTRGIVAFVLFALVLHLALSRLVRFDWNFLFQKSLVALGWLIAFGGLLTTFGRRRSRALWTWGVLLGPLLSLSLFFEASGAAELRRPGSASPLEAQVARDPSARLLRELLLPPIQAARDAIYPLLQRNSNLPQELPVAPVDIQHGALGQGPGPRPDIFIFVVDSLRRDYLGAYNPAVRFTPNLDRFAAESTVLRRAFTRYGATGLSEPSIWVGGPMLHKQYIQPFYPMNSLQKLLRAEGYRMLVSMDSIMEVVLQPGPELQSLEPGVSTQDLRLAASLERLSAALAARRGDARPLFAYTQAQDIHISVINREGQGVVEPGDYGAFYAPYASRIQRLDRAFGAFIAELKRQGRYERSLIVFTADHGDSLGEEGRWGHAYTLFPEILQIPLLVHLPEAWQSATVDPEAPAFLTDLTPSLYYLLGHRPVKSHPLLGRPLFTATASERAGQGEGPCLLASSYGAVFGILDDRGRELYISDGVNFEDHAFRLDGSAAGLRRPVTPALKGRYDRLIAEGIAKLNAFYGFKGRD